MANQYSKVWDKELILNRVKIICEDIMENGQPVPTRSQWDKNNIVPSRRTIEKYSNMTFSEVLEILGYEVANKKPKRYSDLELVSLLREYFDEYNKKPTSKHFKLNENYPDPINYQRRFNSWSKALELAGFSKDDKKYDENVDISNFDSKIKVKKIYTPKMKISEFNQGEWSKEEEEILRSLYLLIDYKEIAELLNRSYNSVKVRANRLGLTIGQINPFSCIEGERWSEEEINILLNEYSHNPKIDELLPVRNKQTIIKKANKLGLKLRRGNVLVKSRFFEELTSESAYIAGFIAADGYINEKQYFLEITLSIKDQDHLEKIADQLGEDIAVKTNKVETSVRLKIVNHKIVDDLVKMNIVQCKTFTLKYFDEMPENLHSHFIRGYLDGDGSIMPKRQNGRILFLGNQHFLEAVREVLSKYCNVKLNKLYPKGNIYELRYHGKSALKVLDWLYYMSELHLERKFIKYKELKLNIEN
ncbi:homing endonuclease associated repeat-containing protein [Solibacillus ferritrahens]|uniref:homing endonuclease associated repeat-containing protein n=1 Tax=Solibacillus ferritrahens TaxID=3098620 RepID=UPI00300803B9